MKALVLLIDGAADWPIEALGGRTPLEAAEHPAMDALARSAGLFGLTRTIPDGLPAGSDVANLSVFGFDPTLCYSGRSPLEAASLGVSMAKDDVAYRMNLVTLSKADEPETASLRDYSAGEMTTTEARQLVDALRDALGSEAERVLGVPFGGRGLSLYDGFSYRHICMLHHAKTGAKLTPPHDISGKPVASYWPKGENADILNALSRLSLRVFADHPVNIARRAKGQNTADCAWFWGEGTKPAIPSFYERYGVKGAVVSAVDLIFGIGRAAGMRTIHVEGATGTFESDFAKKAEAAWNAFTENELVYLHMEGPDECGHHGQLREKILCLERIDRLAVSPLLTRLLEQGEPYSVLLMPDHPTPLKVMTHVAEPVPFALYHRGDDERRSARFTEADARATGLSFGDAYRLMPLLLKI